MRFDGVWLECDDGIVRPLIGAEIESADGHWEPCEFLLDTGADRTVFSTNILDAIGVESVSNDDGVAGVGGMTDTVVFRTQIRLTREHGRKVKFRGEYAAFTEQNALNISVLGRDILELFALIVDRARDTVSMLGGRHQYMIRQV